MPEQAIAPTPAGAAGIVVNTDRSINCATLETIATDVTRGCRTDQEKAIAVYNFMIRMIYMPDHPWRPVERINGKLRFPADPLKYITVYGCCGCGPQARVFGSLLGAAGLEARLLNPGFGHVSNEVKWDGKWHWMDVWLPAYVTDGTGGIYSYDEIMADRELFATARDEGRVPGNFMVLYEDDKGTVLNAGRHRPRTRAGYPQKYTENLGLRPGESCTWLWDNVGKHYWPAGRHPQTVPCGPAARFPNDDALKDAFPYWEPYAKTIENGPRGQKATYYRYYGNAIFECIPPLTRQGLTDLGAQLDNIAFAPGGGIEPDQVGSPPYNTAVGIAELAFDLPYIIADTEIQGTADVIPGGAVSFYYAIDGGRRWTLAEEVRKSGALGPFSIGKPNTYAYPSGTTTGTYGFAVRVVVQGRASNAATTLRHLRVTSTTMLNFYSRPHLEPGKNEVTVTAEKGSTLDQTPLELTWRWLEDWKTEKSLTHQVNKNRANTSIEVGGTKRPKMKSVTIACPTR